jgi:hypothetical protein
MNNTINIPFDIETLQEIIAEHYGYDKEDIDPEYFDEREIAQIILDRII